MKCPYNRKSETYYQKWNQKMGENQSPEKGTTVTQTVYELMDCEKENCEAWQDGKCRYAAVSLLNN